MLFYGFCRSTLSQRLRLKGMCSEFTGTEILKGMAKSTVKLGISSLGSAGLLEKGRTVAEMLNGNLAYAELQPQLPALLALCDTLETANNAVLFNGGKLTHDARRNADKALRSALKDFAGYVQGISGGVKSLILAAGFDVVKQRAPLPPPAAPADLIVRRTDMQGIMKVKWSTVRGTKLSYLEMQEEGSRDWTRVLTTTRSSHVMTSLTTGKEYSFRVQVITSGGQSPMSEVVTNIAA